MAPSTTDQRSTTAHRRRPPWWAVVLVQVAGCWGAYFLGIIALFTLPAQGIFGEANAASTRAVGLLAATGALACLAAGPLFVWAWRRFRR